MKMGRRRRRLSCTISVPPPHPLSLWKRYAFLAFSCIILRTTKIRIESRLFHPPTVSFIRSSTYLRYAPSIHHLDKTKNQDLYKTQKLLSLFMYFTFSSFLLLFSTPFFSPFFLLFFLLFLLHLLLLSS